MTLHAPVALVTGGGRGIGRAICTALAREGMALAINYCRSRDGAEAARKACLEAGAPWAECFPADVADLHAGRRMVDSLLDQTGRIDALVNNAGVSSPVRGDLLEIRPENWDTVLATNLKGPFFLSLTVASAMIAENAHSSGSRRMIVNIGSISAYAASTARGEYCISKAGLAMATQLLAHRLAPHGILVYEVRPGIVRTDMTAAAAEKYDRLIAEGLTPIRRWGEPEDVGAAVAMLARGQLPFSTGEVVNVDGGFHLRSL